MSGSMILFQLIIIAFGVAAMAKFVYGAQQKKSVRVKAKYTYPNANKRNHGRH